MKKPEITIEQAQKIIKEHDENQLMLCQSELSELLKKRGCELVAQLRIGDEFINVPVKLKKSK